ncbi:MAG TPA: SpoIIE family protein phosphatase, partial [Burkholderiaceae bacterium]|nr:SpoIIE family protein phosphatase [Burkholderiaceae bacterium]
MRLTSLRSKIFAFVVALLVLGASIVMVVAQRDVTATVSTSEQRAVDNILKLLADDSLARWGALLGEKANTARQARQPLIQHNALILSVLQLYHEQERQGKLSADQAREQALKWLADIDLGAGRRAVALDHNTHVLTDSPLYGRGTSLARHHDIKGRTFPEIIDRELGTGDHSFVIYHSPDDTAATDLRYAILSRFAPWDWVLAISDSAQPIVDQFDRQRRSMEAALAETLSRLRLPGNGFVFIADHDGLPISALPSAHRSLLRAHITDHDEQHLQKVLQTGDAAAGVPHQLHARSPGRAARHGPDWLLKTTYIKPLKWTIVAAVPRQEMARPATELRNRLGLLFLAGLLLALGIAWLLSARITRPLQNLGEFVRGLPEGDLTQAPALPAHIRQLPALHHDEVGSLAAAFIHMDTQLRENVATLLAETTRRERFESELNIARDIQLGLLPARPAPSVLEHIELHATMLPAKEVGGDLYDYFLLPDGRLCFAIGDVSDKGVPAALFMAMTCTLLRACAEDDTHPARIMERVNTRLADNNPNMMFVTLFIGVLDLHTGQLHWANAGHPALHICHHHGVLVSLEGRSGPACGVQAALPYQGFETFLQPGDTLVG